MYAAWCGHAAIVRTLLEQGADPNADDEVGAPVLMWCMRRHVVRKITALLVEYGADPNRCDRTGTPMLVEAARYNDAATVTWLLTVGADPHTRNRRGWTPLIAVVQEDRVEIVARLLAVGADPNARDQLGWPALMHVTTHGLLCRLLDAGADPAIPDAEGRTLPEIFMTTGRTDLLTHLDEALSKSTRDTQRRGLLASLTAASRAAWLPRSSAIGSAAIKTWDRRAALTASTTA